MMHCAGRLDVSGNTLGTLFTVTTFGESHGPAVGAVIDGTPPGIDIDIAYIQTELARRKPGQSAVSSPRKEKDAVEILSGVFEGKSTGTPITLLIYNRNVRSEDYDELKSVFRPGHADYTYHMKYGIRDYRGGGRSSGRETAARVAAGAVGKCILRNSGVNVLAYTRSAAGITCKNTDYTVIEKNSMRACDMEAAEAMERAVKEIARKGDSAGGIVECRAAGVPAGLGEPVFSKLDAEIAKAVLSVGSVKGIEFGGGFSCAETLGSRWNDGMDETGFLSNNAGGVLGGISTGADIIFRTAVKPTPSIAKRQSTVDIQGKHRNVSVEGRHDPCICPRIVPVIESMTALVLTDMLLIHKARSC